MGVGVGGGIIHTGPDEPELEGSQTVAQIIASWTWDVTRDRALSPADLFGGKAPVGALIGLLERIC